MPCAALAQTPVAPADQAPDQVAFSADQLAYDENTEIVTATGEVRMTREGYNLRADTLNWNRITGEVRAEGNVRVVSPAGDVAYGDSVQLQDTLRDGVIQNLLLVLADGGRLAAIEARRDNGVTTLNQAAYTPCSVVDENGCPKAPTWQITAVRVVHDPVRHRISYRGATLNLFGRPIIGLPGLSHPDGSDGAGGSGVLVPELRYDRINGFEIAVPYYLRLAENRDLTLTPHVYTDVAPMLEAEYRQLTARGAFQIRGYATYSRRVGVNEEPLPGADRAFRGYIEGNGRWQLTPEWSVTASGRYVTDRTFLRRYDISRDDRLRSVIEVERIGADSYISIAGWAFQGLRVTDVEGQQPIVLPAIDARFRLDDPWLGGTFNLQANSLAILRTEGQDTQRAFASAQWDRRMITPWGQELVLTAFARGDVYHASDTLLTQPLYRGTEGWSGRVIGALAADIKWPFIGEFLGGTQRLTPRVQFVAAPVSDNLDIPNEDARAIELEDSNLFALNRFPGYDRWEDGARVTYGADWAFDLPGIRVRTNVGQSYRLSTREAILPPGTGLSGRFSDIVGRTSIQVGRRLSFTHRFRLDKDSFAVRRNEIDATVGGRQTYATIGYLRLNRNVDPSIEDLRDREEVRVGGRVAFARYWSIFGSAVVDLTDRREDPLSQSDGFDPIRHRIGILYDDECLELGVTWRRDYETTGDARRGNTFLIRVALKNLGR
ncbi:LPS assembly protein LptD [Sphingosinicella sp. LHD-64]|nr:LPS assembly protein LptD [Sphingosinicella sp. LHD-64]MDQ8754997.1 LPS assembly protein LptD [Sphingosinicella sp. LHD-64]